VLSRNASTITQVSQRAAAMRRMSHSQQSSRQAGPPLYCRTNGCTTFMRLDAASGIATCPICGARRRIA
jgi:hypothetical protein